MNTDETFMVEKVEVVNNKLIIKIQDVEKPIEIFVNDLIKTELSIDDIYQLKDGTRVKVLQIGKEWEEEIGREMICVKVGNKLFEANLPRPNEDSIWYPYFLIKEINDKGYECKVTLEDKYANI